MILGLLNSSFSIYFFAILSFQIFRVNCNPGHLKTLTRYSRERATPLTLCDPRPDISKAHRRLNVTRKKCYVSLMQPIKKWVFRGMTRSPDSSLSSENVKVQDGLVRPSLALCPSKRFEIHCVRRQFDAHTPDRGSVVAMSSRGRLVFRRACCTHAMGATTL